MNVFVKFGELLGAAWASWAVLEDKLTVMRRRATATRARRRYLFLYRPYRWIRTWS